MVHVTTDQSKAVATQKQLLLRLSTETERFYFSPQKKLEFLLGLPFLFRFDQTADLGNTDS